MMTDHPRPRGKDRDGGVWASQRGHHSTWSCWPSFTSSLYSSPATFSCTSIRDSGSFLSIRRLLDVNYTYLFCLLQHIFLHFRFFKETFFCSAFLNGQGRRSHIVFGLTGCKKEPPGIAQSKERRLSGDRKTKMGTEEAAFSHDLTTVDTEKIGGKVKSTHTHTRNFVWLCWRL